MIEPMVFIFGRLSLPDLFGEVHSCQPSLVRKIGYGTYLIKMDEVNTHTVINDLINARGVYLI